MIQNNYNSVEDALIDLKKIGYSIDFSILKCNECLVCHLTTENSEQVDQRTIYAISSIKDCIEGVVVNTYGMYSGAPISKIVSILYHQLNEE